MCLNCEGLSRRALLAAAAASATAVAAKGAGAQGFTGPTQPKGISAVELGHVPLGLEFPTIDGMNGRQLRIRLWTIEPAGIVPLHSHNDRPAVMYILQGTIVEHRDDRDEPVVHEAGGISKESGGVTHWWENEGDVAVKLVAVDVFNAQPALNGTEASANAGKGC